MMVFLAVRNSEPRHHSVIEDTLLLADPDTASSVYDIVKSLSMEGTKFLTKLVVKVTVRRVQLYHDRIYHHIDG